ncbi:MAG: TolC family protein [Pirellulales bacterium]
MKRNAGTNRKSAVLRVWATCALALWTAGCTMRPPAESFRDSLAHYRDMANRVEYPDVAAATIEASVTETAPMSLHQTEHTPWPMTPEEAVQTALANSTVLRDLGGQVLAAPGITRSILNPSIVETDPRFGVESALSAFDAQFLAGFTAEKNDYISNNRFLAGGTNFLQQDLNALRLQLSKKAATGTEYIFRHNVNYDFNNAPGNYVPNLPWTVFVEGEFRHPLMQGGGVDFNRIAGPSATPGQYNGVMIARLNVDVSLTDFELGLRDLVNNVENAYWDLYYAYRDLEAKVEARDKALVIWQRLDARRKEQALKTPDKEPQAREQYLRLEEEVQLALTGRIQGGTRAAGDMGGGTFRGVGGVQVAERRLRLLLGLPINDGRMIVPSTAPCPAEVKFEWREVTAEALARRAELRRQRIQVKRRELELVASRNFLLPRFDLIGRYRWRGTGHDLLNPNPQPADPLSGAYIDNAYQNLTSGDFQEWRLGGELSLPVGFRQGHSAVRNAQLMLARDRAVLVEQERHVVHDLSNAYAELQRAYDNCRLVFNRRVAARKRLEQIEANLPRDGDGAGDKVELYLSDALEALRRVVEADSSYHAALIEYALAMKNVHFEKGSLLEYNNVYLAEDMWRGQPAVRSAGIVDELLDYSLPGRARLQPPVAPSELDAGDAEPRGAGDEGEGARSSAGASGSTGRSTVASRLESRDELGSGAARGDGSDAGSEAMLRLPMLEGIEGGVSPAGYAPQSR